jgi:hypothetical protein
MAAHGFILLRSVEFFAGAIDKAVIHNVRLEKHFF